MLKGLFLPLLISLVCLAPHPFVDEYQRSHNHDYSRFSVVDVDKVLVPLLSIGLAAFWWRPARWRSYGVLIGLVLLPALLLGLFLAAVAIFDIQVAPK